MRPLNSAGRRCDYHEYLHNRPAEFNDEARSSAMKITDVRTIALSRRDRRSRLARRHRSQRAVQHAGRGRQRRRARSGSAVATRRGRWSKASLELLKPLLIGQIGARAGARQREAAAIDVLARPRRLGRAHDQRPRHRAVGSVGQGARPAGFAAVGRQLSRPHQAVCVDPVRRSAGAGRKTACSKSRAASARSRWAGGRSAA